MKPDSLCPYCGAKVKRQPVSVDLSPKRKEVFNAILAAGAVGLSSTELIDMFFDDGTVERIGSYSTLRSTLHYVNEKLKPHHLRIVAKGGFYRLEKKSD